MIPLSDEELSYYKTSQFIPTKGDSYSFYECEDDFQVKRFVTHIPESGELEKIEVDWSMELRQDGAEEIEKEEFMERWEMDVADSNE